MIFHFFIKWIPFATIMSSKSLLSLQYDQILWSLLITSKDPAQATSLKGMQQSSAVPHSLIFVLVRAVVMWRVFTTFSFLNDGT